ncbi:MAG: cupin domain-containing protein [Propionibacteriaceae bacterium]|nr:cupin domain-containing protein [Propionibacteriaceae bacterium]
MGSIKIANWPQAESYQFDEVTECWTKLIRDRGWGAHLGMASYSSFPDGKDFSDYVHPESAVELYFVVSGEGFVYVEGGEPTAISKGDAFALPPVKRQLWSASDEATLDVLFVEMTGPNAAHWSSE